MKWWLLLAFAALVCCDGDVDSIELYQRLNLLANYVKENPDSQQPDLMLGVYICRGDESPFSAHPRPRQRTMKIIF